MKKISRFDIGMIIAFVVIGLLGGAAWWYLSGELQAAKDEDTNAKSDFDKYSTKSDLVVIKPNIDILQANIDLIQTQLNPIIESKFQPKENKLPSIDKEDPVAWKHDLDDKVRQLTSAAKLHGIKLPPSFYFSFSRYLNQNPGDEQTLVLSKQLLAIDQITTILINSPVQGIQAIRRTYEEDPRGSGPGSGTEGDRLGGLSLQAPGGAYTAYPFEIEFETTSENLRKVVDGLIQSPYVFVLRTLTIQNDHPNSPKVSDLERIVGSPPPSVTGSDPGAVAANTSTQGPQYLFGHSTLLVKARIDLIEWHAGSLETTPASDH